MVGYQHNHDIQQVNKFERLLPKHQSWNLKCKKFRDLELSYKYNGGDLVTWHIMEADLVAEEADLVVEEADLASCRRGSRPCRRVW